MGLILVLVSVGLFCLSILFSFGSNQKDSLGEVVVGGELVFVEPTWVEATGNENPPRPGGGSGPNGAFTTRELFQQSRRGDRDPFIPAHFEGGVAVPTVYLVAISILLCLLGLALVAGAKVGTPPMRARCSATSGFQGDELIDGKLNPIGGRDPNSSITRVARPFSLTVLGALALLFCSFGVAFLLYICFTYPPELIGPRIFFNLLVIAPVFIGSWCSLLVGGGRGLMGLRMVCGLWVLEGLGVVLTKYSGESLGYMAGHMVGFLIAPAVLYGITLIPAYRRWVVEVSSATPAPDGPDGPDGVPFQCEGCGELLWISTSDFGRAVLCKGCDFANVFWLDSERARVPDGATLVPDQFRDREDNGAAIPDLEDELLAVRERVAQAEQLVAVDAEKARLRAQIDEAQEKLRLLIGDTDT